MKSVDQIVEAIGRRFRTFGGGVSSKWNPMSLALRNDPLSFAGAVDVREVVEFVLNYAECADCQRRITMLEDAIRNLVNADGPFAEVEAREVLLDLLNG